MANIRPFPCVRPEQTKADRVAALPYDVYNRAEAKAAVFGNPLSFLNIDRPETQFSDDQDMYAPEVYQKAKELLSERMQDGTFVVDDTPSYYIYELIMEGRSQTGIVACASIDDYCNNVIKKHENTREEKEQDRIRHVDVCGAQTGPIFLAYRSDQTIRAVVDEVKKKSPLYSFVADDGISHNVWVINDKAQLATIQKAFSSIGQIYIADGHHRAASAVKVGLIRREEHKGYTGEEEFNFFLSVLFPEDQLMILPYNRVVKDLNGRSKEEFLEEISKSFTIEACGNEAISPSKKGQFGMFFLDTWYLLTAKEELLQRNDPVLNLDVSILQDFLLEPILGIKDPRVDKRIDFIGGIRGTKELERRCRLDMKVAFSMYPTSIGELFAVSDAGKLMPPKSTWFEPKLRSGLFIHQI